MSEAIDTGVRRRRSSGPRQAPKPTAAFFVLQVLDDAGDPVEFDKKNLRIVSVERSAEKVLEIVENGEHDHAFYVRGMVPAARVPAAKPAVG